MLTLLKIFKLHICEHERQETIMQIRYNKIGLYAPQIFNTFNIILKYILL